MAAPYLIERFANVPLDVTAAIAVRPLRVSRILSLRAGEVLATGMPVAAGVLVFAGNARIGAGECLGAGLRFSVRLAGVGSGGK